MLHNFSSGKSVFAFGEVLWDVFPGRSMLGGAPFNFIYRVNSLGMRGVIASRVGSDELGSRALAEAERLGIDTACIQKDTGHPTGKVNITFDKDNQPDYEILPGAAYDHIEAGANILDKARRADCVYFGTLAQRSETSRNTLVKLLDAAGGTLKLLDLNLRKDCYSKETVLWSLDKCDILKLNDDEVTILRDILEISPGDITGFCREAVDRWNLRYCLVTMGDKGVFAVSGTEQVYVPGYEVDVMDPVGAGDAFTAGFIVALLGGSVLRGACEYGNAAGAAVCTGKSGTCPVSREDIEKIMNSPEKRVADKRLSG